MLIVNLGVAVIVYAASPVVFIFKKFPYINTQLCTEINFKTPVVLIMVILSYMLGQHRELYILIRHILLVKMNVEPDH